MPVAENIVVLPSKYKFTLISSVSQLRVSYWLSAAPQENFWRLIEPHISIHVSTHHKLCKNIQHIGRSIRSSNSSKCGSTWIKSFNNNIRLFVPLSVVTAVIRLLFISSSIGTSIQLKADSKLFSMPIANWRKKEPMCQRHFLKTKSVEHLMFNLIWDAQIYEDLVKFGVKLTTKPIRTFSSSSPTSHKLFSSLWITSKIRAFSNQLGEKKKSIFRISMNKVLSIYFFQWLIL